MCEPLSSLACLDGRGVDESSVQEGRVSWIILFECFLWEEREEFGGVLTTSNSSFLIPPNWRDLEGE